mgnify:FL=1
MKRTGEIALTIIGAVFNLIGVGIFSLFTTFSKTDYFMYNFLGAYGTEEDVFFINIMTGIGWFLSIISLLALIAGIVALLFFKGDKKPKAAGIILIITSVILALGTFMMAFLAALCYLIAGIMGLVRKPPQADQDEIITDSAAEL